AVTAAGAPEGVAMAETALADGELLEDDTSIAIGLALAPLVWGDRLDAALAVWDEVIARARIRGAPLRYAFAVTYRAEVHLRVGAGPASALSDYQGNNLLLIARGRLRLAQGRTAEAAEDLLELGRRCDGFTLRNPAAIPWRSHAALAIHHEAPGRATALADEEAELAATFGAQRALGISLRACGLVRQGAESIERLRQAVEVLRTSPAALELARALVDLGAAERRGGARVSARRSLGEGLDAAAACGSVPLIERARSELVAAGARPRRDRITGRDALTASELRVARMASEGKTNREIAEALWVTLSTVEAHLTRVYRKLDISERAELPDALHRAPIPA